jgi:lipoate-protein ligase B
VVTSKKATLSVFIERTSEQAPFRFEDLLRLQDEVLAQIRVNSESALVFAELAPVVTVGRRQLNDSHELSRLKTLGIEIVSGERGGNETWHGPGQWTCFVLTPLKSFTGDALGVRKAVHRILGHTLTLTQKYLSDSHLREGSELGIWSTEGKLVSVGIKINNGYITSGFAVNCIPNPNAFLGINPCGISNARPDFLFRELAGDALDAEFLKLPSLIREIFSEPF